MIWISTDTDISCSLNFFTFISFVHIFDYFKEATMVFSLVPFSASTLSQTCIYNDLATILTKLFSIMAQSSPQIYLLQSSFLFERDFLLSGVSFWPSIVLSHSREFQHYTMGWSNSNLTLITLKLSQLPLYYSPTLPPAASDPCPSL